MAYYPITPVQVGNNARVDFSPITNALDGYMQQRDRAQQRGMQQQQLGMERERLGLAKNADARAGEDQASQREQRIAQKFGSLAQVIYDDPNPATAQANWGRLVQGAPQLAQKLQAYGVDPRDYRAASQFLMAESGKYKTPAQREAERLALASSRQSLASGALDMDLKRRKLAAPVPDGSKVIEAADGSIVRVPPGGQGEVVYRGGPKPPAMNATAMKTLEEADSFASQNRGAMDIIDQAIVLNSKANAGFGAGARSLLANNLPDALVPDFISSPESARSTVDLDNLVTTQALQTLRSTFGGNPTEGERQILLEVSGSVNQPREVRAQIYRRAKAAAERRMMENQEKADAIRRGTYYTPGYQPGKPQSNLSNTQNTPAAAMTGQAEAQRVINGKTYVKIGGQWYDPGQ